MSNIRTRVDKLEAQQREADSTSGPLLIIYREFSTGSLWRVWRDGVPSVMTDDEFNAATWPVGSVLLCERIVTVEDVREGA